jgi:hypothetical protein
MVEYNISLNNLKCLLTSHLNQGLLIGCN